MRDFFKLPDLTQQGKDDDIGGTIQRLSGQLEGCGEDARVQFRFVGAEENPCWCVVLSEKGNGVVAERVDRPDLEVITRAGTWREVASGATSPVDALLQGKLRVRGDIELARRLGQRLLQLAGVPGAKLERC